MTTPLILDGGMSRELMRLNAPFRQPEWSALALIEAPHLVKRVHTDFIAAGADIITTNSYALVPFHIGEERFWTQGAQLAALAGRLAREAADAESTGTGRKILVAGSLPPIFGSYLPRKFNERRVQEYLGVLVAALAPYVDVWLAETLSLIAEAVAARHATKSTGKPFWAAFCPDDGRGASASAVRLRSGETVEQVAEWATASHIDALLFNCARPAYVEGAVKIAKETLNMRSEQSQYWLLGAYANAFAPKSNECAANESISAVDEALDPKAYGQHAEKWVSDGVGIVGGCCGVGHEHIPQLKGVLP